MPESSDVSSKVGTRLLFENERVRVWDLRLEPGESTGLHQHDKDYFYVVIGDGALQTKFANGSTAPAKQMADGEVHFRKIDEPAVHEAVNVGDTPWRNIVVELK